MTGLEPTQKDIKAGKGNDREQESRSNTFPQMKPLFAGHRPPAGEMGEHEL